MSPSSNTTQWRQCVRRNAKAQASRGLPWRGRMSVCLLPGVEGESRRAGGGPRAQKATRTTCLAGCLTQDLESWLFCVSGGDESCRKSSKLDTYPTSTGLVSTVGDAEENSMVQGCRRQISQLPGVPRVRRLRSVVFPQRTHGFGERSTGE